VTDMCAVSSITVNPIGALTSAVADEQARDRWEQGRPVGVPSGRLRLDRNDARNQRKQV